MNTIAQFFLFILCTQQFILAVTSKYCGHFYHATKNDKCAPCNRAVCGPGEILVKNCGYDQNGYRIPGKSMCKKCAQNEYSCHNTHTCILCKTCRGRPKERRFKSVCSKSTDAVCEDCPAGYRNDKHDNCIEVIGITHPTEKSVENVTAKELSRRSEKQLSRGTVMNISTSPFKKLSVQMHTTSEPSVKSTNRVSPVTSLSPHSVTANRSAGVDTAQFTRTAPQLRNRINTRIEATPKSHLGRSLLLISVFGGVLIVVMLVVILTKKSIKSKEEHQAKLPQMDMDDLESNRTPLTIESTTDLDEANGDGTYDNGADVSAEVVVSDSQYFDPDPVGELKAQPFVPSYDDASVNYYSVVDQPFIKDNEESKLAGNSGLNSCSFGLSRMAGFHSGRGIPLDQRSQQPSERYRNQRTRFCLRCKQGSNIKHCDFDGKLIDIKECQKTTLKEKLDLDTEGTNNWKEVATYFDIPQTTILSWTAKIKAGESPTESVIYYLGTQNVTVAQLLLCLDRLRRYDACDALVNHLQYKCYICKADFLLARKVFN